VTPRPSWRERRSTLLLSSAARVVLGTLALLLLASVAPALAGWQSTVVLSGSMQPGVSPGDVAVVRPVPIKQLAIGDVLLVDDPDAPGQLRLHRLVEVEGAGLRLQGDANPTADPRLVDPAAVHGVAVLDLPGLGLPVLWAREGRTAMVAGSALALALLTGLALAHRGPPDDDGPAPGSGSPSGRRRGRVVVPMVALGSTALLGLLPGISAAGATFTATTATSADSWTSARYFSCTSGGASAPGYLALQETAGPIAYNTGLYASSVSGYYSSTGITYQVPGPPCDGDGHAVRLDGSSGVVYSTTAVYNPQTFSVQLWFATTTDRGGKLIGFGSATNGGASTQADRHVWMTDAGQLAFGVNDNGTYKTTTTAAKKPYNDGRWHMMSATFSPATGLRLYVDGAPVSALPTATAAEVYTGYWRVGYDSIGPNWPGAPSSEHFAGSVGHLSVYVTLLTDADIADQYAARN
jgi:hypothetical protein